MLLTFTCRLPSSKTFYWTKQTNAFPKTWLSSWGRTWSRWRRRRVTSTRYPTTWTLLSVRMLPPQSADQETLRTRGKLTTTLYNLKMFYVNNEHGFPQQSLDCHAILLPVHWDGLCLSDLNAAGGCHTCCNIKNASNFVYILSNKFDGLFFWKPLLQPFSYEEAEEACRPGLHVFLHGRLLHLLPPGQTFVDLCWCWVAFLTDAYFREQMSSQIQTHSSASWTRTFRYDLQFSCFRSMPLGKVWINYMG